MGRTLRLSFRPRRCPTKPCSRLWRRVRAASSAWARNAACSTTPQRIRSPTRSPCWRLWFPRPGFISYATTGSWRPGLGPATASCRPAGCRVGGGGRLGERCVLRPSAVLGDPAGAGVFLRPQRMRGLWRSPENHRRPDRSGFDPDLSGGGRAAGDAPAESPASAAVRVRRLTYLLDPSPAPGVRLGVPSTSSQATKLLRARSKDWQNDPQGSCRTLAVRCPPCPRVQKRCLIFPILH